MDLVLSVFVVLSVISTPIRVESATISRLTFWDGNNHALELRSDNDLIRNGGFEQNAVGNCPWKTIHPPHWDGWISNYIVKGCTGSTFVYKGCSNCDGMGMLKYEGDYFIQLHGSAAKDPFYQQIDGLVDQQTYNISFTAATRPTQGNSFLFVKIDGETVFTTNSMPDDKTWRQYSFLYTANKNSIKLGFNHCKGGRNNVKCILTDGTDVSDKVSRDSSPFIDDVHFFQEGPAETCDDGIQNQDETGVDCGGVCSACETCEDGIQNQDETGIDCGGVCTACVVHIFKFNATCCEAHGVPEECMGLCRPRDENRRRRRSVDVLPVDRCVEHQENIKSCVYQYVPPTHCEWNEWEIPECSKTCGGGSRTKSRTKAVEESNGTDEAGVCDGESTMEEECNTQDCPPIHCEWNDWEHGECSDSCGTGTRTNTRTKSVVEEHGGTCTGQTTEIEECNTNPCPIDCKWGEWTSGECTKSCGGGEQTNTRVPDTHAQHGGQDCTGHAEVTESCNTQECPVDCKWSNWVNGECTETCGGGERTDTREMFVEKFGGNPCEGEATRIEECNTNECPVDCEWNDWQAGECSKTCGGGSETLTRTKKTEEAFGGNCDGEPTMQADCNEQQCPPIHCQWDEWVIGECSDSCGTGTRTNTRTKLVVEANGGSCTGQSSEVEECNPQPCPIDCEWGNWQVGDCDKSCGGGFLTKSREPQTDAQHGGEECHGEPEITESCNVQECPVDCVWGAWESGECSKTCGDGVLTVTREKIIEDQFGGIPCEGEATREGECNKGDCPIVYKFDETCCTGKGVPEQCMGLCREKSDRDVEEIFPIDQCKEHLDSIQACLGVEQEVSQVQEVCEKKYNGYYSYGDCGETNDVHSFEECCRLTKERQELQPNRGINRFSYNGHKCYFKCGGNQDNRGGSFWSSTEDISTCTCG